MLAIKNRVNNFYNTYIKHKGGIYYAVSDNEKWGGKERDGKSIECNVK